MSSKDTTERVFRRRASFNECLYLVAENIKPGFCIQMVFEGSQHGTLACETAQSFETKLRDAIHQASASHPGTRLVLRGVLGWKHWVALGPTPPLRLVEGWDLQDHPPPEVDRPLPPHTGPTCEVILTKAPGQCLVFRAFHGIMDAGGLLLFAEDVFRALHGHALANTNHTECDTEVLTSLVGKRTRETVTSEHPLLAPETDETSRAIRWHRHTLAGPMPSMVAKVAVSLARYATQFKHANVRLMIPVDIRNYAKKLRSTANMSYPIFIDASPEDTWKQVQKRILRALIKKDALQLDPLERFAPWLPLWILKLSYLAWLKQHRTRRRFPMTALVSHVAMKHSDLFDTPDFTLQSSYFLPAKSDFLPLNITAVSTPHTTDVVLSAPSDLLPERHLAAIGKTITEEAQARPLHHPAAPLEKDTTPTD